MPTGTAPQSDFNIQLRKWTVSYKYCDHRDTNIATAYIKFKLILFATFPYKKNQQAFKDEYKTMILLRLTVYRSQRYMNANRYKI